MSTTMIAARANVSGHRLRCRSAAGCATTICGAAACAATVCAAAMGRVMAVSYTHLDVYKRQT